MITAKQLIEEVSKWPSDTPIVIEVNGNQSFATTVDYERKLGGVEALIINDYPQHDDYLPKLGVNEP